MLNVMQNKIFQQCLADVYHGEIVGEEAFDNMLGQVQSSEEQYIMGSLLQYEAEAKAMMRPLRMRYGVAMHDATGQAAISSRCYTNPPNTRGTSSPSGPARPAP